MKAESTMNKHIRASDYILPPIVLDEHGNDPNDGIKYINIYAHGAEELGRLLAPITHMPFTHPDYGNFQNLQGFWEWLKSKERPDALRYVTGRQAIEIGRGLTKDYVERFHDIILEANFCRIDQNQQLHEAFLKSELPFEMYYLKNPHSHNPLPIRPSTRELMVNSFTELRDMMKAGHRPSGFEHYIRPACAR